MTVSVEADFDAVMNQSFALHAISNVHLRQQVDRTLLQHTGADSLFTVLPASGVNDDGVDALQMEQLRQHKSCGPGSHNPNLRAHSHSG
jgi:hypothetical protein